jgi:PKD repeat protein
MTKNVLRALIAISLLITTPVPSKSAERANLKKKLSALISSIIDPAMLEMQPPEASPISSRIVQDILILSTDAVSSASEIYFPMHNGDSKSYAWSTYNSTLTYSNVFYNGRNAFLEVDTQDGSKAYYGYLGGDLYMFGGKVEDFDMNFNAPLLMLNDAVLDAGESINSSTSFVLEGFTVTIDYSAEVTKTCNVSVPAAVYRNCRSITMRFKFRVPGESESLELMDAWVLAPYVGKIQVAVYDQFLNQKEWASLLGGTVDGKNVKDLVMPLKADFIAEPTTGTAPLLVSFSDRSKGYFDSWVWDFGDGTVGSGKNPDHRYSNPGIFDVKLSISDPCGSDIEVKWKHITVNVQDSDGDGLSDPLEDQGCTSASDRDTDDDGISDGIEDVNRDGVVDAGETDPCKSDSDTDGIQDGTELGLTSDDIDSGTNSTFFQPDLDPSTTSDPLNPDSDRDGLTDGEEDLNFNGRLDLGETNPNRSNRKTLPWLLLIIGD